MYQGALNTGRGLEAAIAAMQLIDNMQLWLAGEGDLSAELRQLAVELGVQDKVHFLGFVSPDDLKTRTAAYFTPPLLLIGAMEVKIFQP